MDNSNSSKHIFYFDALRALAILFVVLLHVTGHLGELMNYNSLTIYSLSGLFETFGNNFFRIGVVLFFMLSGALLLGRDWTLKGSCPNAFLALQSHFFFGHSHSQ